MPIPPHMHIPAHTRWGFALKYFSYRKVATDEYVSYMNISLSTRTIVDGSRALTDSHSVMDAVETQFSLLSAALEKRRKELRVQIMERTQVRVHALMTQTA